jgi:hypothetical protein
MAIVAHPTFTLPSYTFDLSPWLGALNAPRAAGAKPHTLTVELAGATGSDWWLANSLLLWRAPGGGRVTALRGPDVTRSPGLAARATSACDGADPTVAGTCTLELPERELVAQAVLDIDGVEWLARAHYRTGAYSNVMPYNGTTGFAAWTQVVAPHEASWSLATRGNKVVSGGAAQSGRQGGRGGGGAVLRRRGRRGGGTLLGLGAAAGPAEGDSLRYVTRHAARHEWLNAGGIAPGQPYELSANLTLLEPTVYAPLAGPGCGGAPPVVVTGGLRHYQRQIMLDVYTPGAPVAPAPPPGNATHTAALSSTLRSAGRGAADAPGCVAWAAEAAFGAPKPARSALLVEKALCTQLGNLTDIMLGAGARPPAAAPTVNYTV